MSIRVLMGNTLILAIIGWWGAPNAKATDVRIVCPPEIIPKDVRIVRAPAGWTPFVPFEYTPGIPLHSAAVMSGPPSDMATSKPEELGEPNEDVFPDMRPGKEGNWMACFYGGYQHMILSQRLPDTVTECRVAYSKDAQKRVKLDIRCH